MRLRDLAIAGLLGASMVVALPAAAAETAEFLSDGDAKIVRRAADGSVVGTVADGSGAQWSPDGTRIAFRRGSEILVAAIGGEARRIWASSASNAVVQELGWSPDGETIAFVRRDPAGADILTIPSSGGSTRRLTSTAGDKARLTWQPRGHLIAYEWQPSDPAIVALAGTWVVDAETGASRRIGPRGPAFVGDESRIGWSPDGTELALADPRGAIRVHAADGTLRRTIGGLGDTVSGVSWSPDGGRIAFTWHDEFPELYSRFGTRSLGDLYVVDSDGSNLRRLTGVPGDAACDWRRSACNGSTETLRPSSYFARWWPGGNRLLFVRGYDAWTMNADGTCEQRFADTQRVYNPRWSPVAPPLPAVECVSTEVRIRWSRKPGGLRSGTAFTVFVRNEGTQTLSEAILEVETNSDRVDGAGGARSVRDGHYLFRIGALAPGSETLVQLRAWGTAKVPGALLKAHVWNFVPPLVEDEPVPELLQVWATSCDDVGTGRDERLVGTDQPERICANGGADRISGRAGGDDLRGGEGADTIDGGRGRDVIDAGPGADVVAVRDGEVDIVDCGRGTDRAVADAKDRLRGCERVSRG